MRFFLLTIFLSIYTCFSSFNIFSIDKVRKLAYENLINLYSKELGKISYDSDLHKKKPLYQDIQSVVSFTNNADPQREQKVFNLDYNYCIKFLKLAAVTSSFKYDQKKEALVLGQHPEYPYELPFEICIRHSAYTPFEANDYWRILKEGTPKDFLGLGYRIPAILCVQACLGAIPGYDQRGNLALISRVGEAFDYPPEPTEVTCMENAILIKGGVIFKDLEKEIRKLEQSLREPNRFPPHFSN